MDRNKWAATIVGSFIVVTLFLPWVSVEFFLVSSHVSGIRAFTGYAISILLIDIVAVGLLLSRDQFSTRMSALISVLLAAAICGIAIYVMVQIYQDYLGKISFGLVLTLLGGIGMVLTAGVAADQSEE